MSSIIKLAFLSILIGVTLTAMSFAWRHHISKLGGKVCIQEVAYHGFPFDYYGEGLVFEPSGVAILCHPPDNEINAVGLVEDLLVWAIVGAPFAATWMSRGRNEHE
jgi:hypothetical protein